MSFLFRNKKKDKADLDQGYYDRQKAYNAARQAERIRMAKAKGTADAHREANKKPFYQKVIGVAQAVGKDLTTPTPNGGFFNEKASENLFTWGTPKQPRKKRTKRKTKKR